MKRTIAILVGVVSVGASAYLASHLYAQTAQPYNPAAAPAAPAAHCTSKIACINLQKVIKDYLKFKNVQADMKKEADSYRVQIDTFNAKIKQLQTQGELPTTTPEQRETIARQIKDVQRQAQDKERATQQHVVQAHWYRRQRGPHREGRHRHLRLSRAFNSISLNLHDLGCL